jgi:hypothetical protein
VRGICERRGVWGERGLGHGAIVMKGKVIVFLEAKGGDVFANLRGSDWLDEHDDLTTLDSVLHDDSPLLVLVSPLPKNPPDSQNGLCRFRERR